MADEVEARLFGKQGQGLDERRHTLLGYEAPGVHHAPRPWSLSRLCDRERPVLDAHRDELGVGKLPPAALFDRMLDHAAGVAGGRPTEGGQVSLQPECRTKRAQPRALVED